MALQKDFLKPSIEQLPIPKWQWILNIVVHIGLAFTFYLFAIYIKEMYKYLHFDSFSPFTIEAQLKAMPSTFSYKFCFAFFAILFSQISLLFSLFIKPSFRQWHPRLKSRHKIHLINNARVLQYFSLFFLFSLMTIFYSYGYDYWALFYLKNAALFNTVFILLLVTLSLQQWIELRRYFKKAKKWQWRILALNIGLAILFTFTPTEKIDQYYKQQIAKSFTINYELDFIETENADRTLRRSLVEEGMLAYSKINNPISRICKSTILIIMMLTIHHYPLMIFLHTFNLLKINGANMKNLF